jgi:hypothetical protein
MLNFKDNPFYPLRTFWNRISQKGLKDEFVVIINNLTTST